MNEMTSLSSVLFPGKEKFADWKTSSLRPVRTSEKLLERARTRWMSETMSAI